MENILLISLENINNAGDELLRISTQFLVSRVGKIGGDYRCMQMQFHPRFSDLSITQKFFYVLGFFIKQFSRFPRGDKLKYIIIDKGYKIQFTPYFSAKIKKSSKIIYAVGMLKYSTQDCSYFYYLINSIANKYAKPVFMSAQSIEEADPSDWRYHQLVRAVSFDCVKGITTRDGEFGLLTLKSDYIKSRNIVSDYVGDPALWIPYCYNIPVRRRTDESKNRKSIVGIGLARSDLFSIYHNCFNENQLVTLYSQIIFELESRGYDYFLFCNGISSDYSMGVHLLNVLGLSSKKLIPAPKSAIQLISIIQRCDAVIGVRLHACICAFALGVPVAGILWDNKLEYFSQTMHLRPFFSTINELSGKVIVEKLEASMTQQPDFSLLDIYRNKTLYYIEQFLTDET